MSTCALPVTKNISYSKISQPSHTRAQVSEYAQIFFIHTQIVPLMLRHTKIWRRRSTHNFISLLLDKWDEIDVQNFPAEPSNCPLIIYSCVAEICRGILSTKRTKLHFRVCGTLGGHPTPREPPHDRPGVLPEGPCARLAKPGLFY